MAMSNDAVAEAYATGATKGASKNMYIDGDSIYSYGPHFPIAERIPGGYTFNSDNYSPTTNRHKSFVWSRIHKDILWELPGCQMHKALQVYARRVLDAMKKIPRCRSGFNFSRYLEHLEFNFGKAIEASEKLDQDIQPLYNVMDEEIVAAAIKRIKKEKGEIPDVMLAVFGKAKFLA
jgi:uncharacterized protein YdcH (DUF465 family)